MTRKSLILAVWLPLLACLLVVRHYTNDPSSLDWGATASTFRPVSRVGDRASGSARRPPGEGVGRDGGGP